MRIEFNVTLRLEDYQDLVANGQLDLVWTHYACMDWLDNLNYSCETCEIINEDRNTSDLYYSYWIDEHTLDFILMKWPRILEPVRDYEQVRIIG